VGIVRARPLQRGADRGDRLEVDTRPLAFEGARLLEHEKADEGDYERDCHEDRCADER
jgi:hypothetical protein